MPLRWIKKSSLRALVTMRFAEYIDNCVTLNVKTDELRKKQCLSDKPVMCLKIMNIMDHVSMISV
jgi:hypothetical protein